MNHAAPSSAGSPAANDDYFVVARRYRPQTFAEIIGQDHVVRALCGAIETHRVGHAYLFSGARGVGKTSAARILAKALNCEQGPGITPCCRCETCVAVGGGEDVDVLEIDGASNRGIDEIRQLRQNVGIRPSRSRYKIYIIDEVHMLTKDAFNALLKTLEEPPAHVKFIFATTEPAKIPATILSRCQRFDFAGVEPRQIATRLRQIVESEGVAVDDPALELISRMAEGSLRDSQSLLERLLASGQRSIGMQDVYDLLGVHPVARTAGIVQAIGEGQAAEALARFDRALAEGGEAEQLLEQLLGFYRDIMLAAVGGKPEQFRYASLSMAAEVEGLARRSGVEKSLAAVQILHQALAAFRNSLHGRIIAEAALVRLSRLELVDDLAALVAELRGESGHRPGSSRPAPAEQHEVQRPADGKKNDPPAASIGSTERIERLDPQPNDTHVGTSADSSAQLQQSPRGWSVESAGSLWREAVAKLRDRGELVADQAAFFGSVTAREGGLLVVGFPARYTSCRNFCDEPSQKAKLEEVLRELTGTELRLKFSLDEGCDSGNEPSETPLSRRQLQLEVAGRPMVRCAVELFDGGSLKVTPGR